jgi:serine phosphatase RsbU (regulator of sigma subunit)
MTPDPEPAARRRKRSDAALNHAALIDAARRLLADDPAATMAEIAAAASVGRGTAYRHFPTRDDLIEAVRRQSRDDAVTNEDDYLRPPGEVGAVTPTPLSVPDVLNKVPPFQLGMQIVAEAQRLDGVSAAAIYLVDLDGASMQRLAGAESFPSKLSVPLAIGPEIPREGIEAARASIEKRLPGVTVAPLFLRGRALGVLLATGPGDDKLLDLAHEAAAAIALSDGYTDFNEIVRRTRDTSPAAEIQQNLLPPRIVRVGGAIFAGNVLPGYEVGGDWFDYTENPDCAWIGIADADGNGARAAGIAAVLLGAFRSARRRPSCNPVDAVRLMHTVLREVSMPGATASATIATWNAPSSTLTWITCGEIAPILIHRNGDLEPFASRYPALGAARFPRKLESNSITLTVGQRVVLASDGVLHRPTEDGEAFGIEGVRAAVAKAPDHSAPATLRAIEDAAREASVTPLQDDATLVVIAPSLLAGAST